MSGRRGGIGRLTRESNGLLQSKKPFESRQGIQRSRTREMFEESSFSETKEVLQSIPARKQESDIPNRFRGSSSQETRSSQRLDIHGIPYRDPLPNQLMRGVRIDNAVGSSLADTSDSGSVSILNGVRPPRLPPPTSFASVSSLGARMSATAVLTPSPVGVETVSETLVHPAHPRYQHQFRVIHDQTGRRIMIPDYGYSTHGINVQSDTLVQPVEGASPRYVHPRPLPRPHINPFTTAAPNLFLGGGSSDEEGEVMRGGFGSGFGKNQMKHAAVGGGEVDGVAVGGVSTPNRSRKTHHGNSSNDSTLTNPPTVSSPGEIALTHAQEPAARRLRVSRRYDLERRIEITPILDAGPSHPQAAHIRPTHRFEVEEPPRTAQDDSRGSSVFASARSMMQGLRRLRDEEEMASVPMGSRLPVGVTPRLLQTPGAYRACLAEKQEMCSKAIFVLCVVFPPAWLVYWLGGFDWYMRHVSRDAVKEMSEEYKARALPVGVIWGLVTVAVITLIIIYPSKDF